MVRFLARWLIAALGLWLAAKVIPGVSYSGFGSLVLAALLLGVVNAIIRPLAVIITFPLTLLTLGLFLLVVNAGMIGLVALLLKGFTVTGLVPGLLAAVVTGAVSWIGHAVIGEGQKT